MNQKKTMAEIFHTIFCRQDHEIDMIKLESSEKCCYYLEQTIEKTWECSSHLEWLEWAEFFTTLSSADSITMLQHIINIHKAAEALKQENPLYLKYVRMIIGGE